MKKVAVLVWGLAAIISATVAVQAVRTISEAGPGADLLGLASELSFALVLPAFAIVAALILSRQPRNIIGWLLFLPPLALMADAIGRFEPYIQSFSTPPNPVPLRLWFSWYFSTTLWLLLIFPLFFIPMLFPTGRPASPRWRWLLYAGLAMCAIFVVFAAFLQQFNMKDFGLDWIVINPIGFLPNELVEGPFIAVWGLGMLTMAILSFVSLFTRYRRASLLEREQIKWLLFALGLFVISYMVAFPLNYKPDFPLFAAISAESLRPIANLLWHYSLIGIPISIGIAILRYRLWDIDVIIRRTLIYSALTVTLAVVFMTSVTLLQSAFTLVSGQHSAIATVISTLLIAALFYPLRRRIQNDIDRRFYRKKYNAEQAIERFAATARQSTDLEALSAELQAVISETMQPENVSFWLIPTKNRERAIKQL